MDADLVDHLRQLVKNQGTTLYVSLVLDEFGLTRVQEIKDLGFFVRRCIALQEENE